METRDKAFIPDWLYRFTEINVNDGVVMCGSVQTYIETLVYFGRNADDNLKELKTLLEAEDYAELAIKVHSVKSTALLIGAPRLSELAKRLEEAADRGDTEYVEKHMDGLISMYKEIADTVQPLCIQVSGEPEEKRDLIEPEDVAGLFRHLAEYIRDYNDEAVGSMLKALGRYDFPTKDSQDKFNAIKKAHERVDWEEMNRLIAED